MLTRRRRCGVGKPKGSLEVAAQYIETEKDPPHFIVKLFQKKGRGIVTQRDISKGEFLLEYPGQLITAQEGKQREEEESSGFRFFLKHQGQSYCLDATDEIFGDRLGRLVNHGQGKEENARMKMLDIKSHPHLCIFATKNISKGTEVLYDYGVRGLPWTKKDFREQVQRQEEVETQVHQHRETEDYQQEGHTQGTQVHQQGETKDHHQEGHTQGLQIHQQERETQICQHRETQVHQGVTEDHQEEGQTQGSQVHQQGVTGDHQEEGQTQGSQVHQQGVTEDHQQEGQTQGPQVHQQGETKGTQVHQQGETKDHQQEGQTRTQVHQQGETKDHHQEGQTQGSQVHQQERETQICRHRETQVHQGVTEDHQEGGQTQGSQVHQQGEPEDHQQEGQTQETQVHQQGETEDHQQVGQALGTQVHQQGETKDHQQEGTQVNQQEETEDHQHRETQVHQGMTEDHQEEGQTQGTQVHQQGESEDHQQEGEIQEPQVHQQGEKEDHRQEGEIQGAQVHQQGETEDHQQEEETQGRQVHQQGETEDHQQEGQTQETQVHQQGETKDHQQEGTQVDQQEETEDHQHRETQVHQGMTEDHQQEGEIQEPQVHQQGEKEDHRQEGEIQEAQVHQQGETEDHQQEEETQGRQVHQQGETEDHQQEGQTQETQVHQQGETEDHKQEGQAQEPQVHQQGEKEDHQQEGETQLHQQEKGTQIHQQERRTLEQEGETQVYWQERDTQVHQKGETGDHSQERVTPGLQQGDSQGQHPVEGEFKGLEQSVHPQKCVSPSNCSSDEEEQYTYPRRFIYPNLSKSSSELQNQFASDELCDDERFDARSETFDLDSTYQPEEESKKEFSSDDATPKIHSRNVQVRNRPSAVISTRDEFDTDSETSALDPTYRPEGGTDEEYSSDETTPEIHPRNVRVHKRPSSVISSPDEKPRKMYKQCLPGSFSGPELPLQKTNNSMERKRKHEDKKKRYKKPSRPCPFCNKACGEKLSRHIRLIHKDEEQVKSAMQLPKRKRDKVFSQFRKEGIYQVNRERMKDDDPIYEREKLPKSGSNIKLKMCSNCKGFYSSHFFWHHRKVCQGDVCTPSEGVPVNLMEGKDPVYHKHPDFVTDILNRFQNDDVGNTCRSDKVIVNVGHRLWTKQRSKKDKKLEVRKSVMADMRRLSTLYAAFKKKHEVHGTTDLTMGHAGDMFSREHFDSLTEAIQTLTYDESDAKLKPGLKLSLYFVLKKACKITKASFLVSRLDEDASEIDKFVEILDLNQNLIFGDAHYEIQKNRQVRLRKPAELPLEADMEALKTYTQKKVIEIISDEYLVWDSHAFVELRDLTCSRLTLWNARRGGEPSRLTTREWRDAEEGVWIQEDKIQEVKDPAHRELLAQLKICYQTGKGTNRLVPVLFPRDTVKPVQLLCDQEIRHAAGIRPDNNYIFACTQMSPDHIGGWHALKNVSDNISLSAKIKVNATKNRHRVSTIYASLDLPDADLDLFYRHMGHSSTINQTIYQTPLAIQEITRVGSHLNHIDIGDDMTRTSTADRPASGSKPTPSSQSPAQTNEQDKATPEPAKVATPMTAKSTLLPTTGTPKPDTPPLANPPTAPDDMTRTSTADRPASGSKPTLSSQSPAQTNEQDKATPEPAKVATPMTAKSTLLPTTGTPKPDTPPLAKPPTATARRYTRWSNQGNKQCKQYFSAAIKHGEPLPGRRACTAFLQKYQITMEWEAVRNKVMNERNKVKKNFDDRERSFLN